MPLKRVTFTGADNSVNPKDLIRLSIAYPFVEWGILVFMLDEPSVMKHSRFPTMRWIDELLVHRIEAVTQFSLHICGRSMASIIRERQWFVPAEFDRFQMNYHAEPTGNSLEQEESAILFAMAPHQSCVIQVDGNEGEALYHRMRQTNIRVHGLFDLSHGAGVLPKKWPKASQLSPNKDRLVGYAGGLGPENLSTSIQVIEKASEGHDYWIDMETRVRSDNDRKFDLDKVEHCIKQVKDYVQS